MAGLGQTQPISNRTNVDLFGRRGVESPLTRSISTLGQSAQTTSAMMKKQFDPDAERTTGGAMLSGLGGAIAGAELAGTAAGGQALGTLGTMMFGGTMESVAAGTLAGPLGIAIGGLIGIGAYLLG